MDDWEKVVTKIINETLKVTGENIEQDKIKMSILWYLYKSTETKEIFLRNCEVLNKYYKEDIESKRYK